MESKQQPQPPDGLSSQPSESNGNSNNNNNNDNNNSNNNNNNEQSSSNSNNQTEQAPQVATNAASSVDASLSPPPAKIAKMSSGSDDEADQACSNAAGPETLANKERKESDKSKASTTSKADSPTTKKNRCAKCGKKLGLTGAFECRCGGIYCAVHRYSDRHECTFDYRALGAEEIRRDNPVVSAEKVRKL